MLQVMLHNPVAEPGLLGVSSGAGLAAMVAMAVAKGLWAHLPGQGLSLAAFGGAPGGDHAAHPSRTPGTARPWRLLLFGSPSASSPMRP